MKPAPRLPQKLSAKNALATLQQGVAAQRAKDFQRAEFCYQSVLRENPKHPDALNLMGTLAREAQKNTVAISYFRKALKQRPRDPSILYNLASAQIVEDKPKNALETLRTLTAIDDKSVRGWVLVGRANAKLGDHTAALAAFDKAVALDPEDSIATVERGEILVELGQMDAAAEIFRSAIASNRNTIKAMSGLSVAHRFKPDDPEPDQMLAQLERSDLSANQRKGLRYAAGKALADQKRYDAAFAQFTTAKTETGDTFPLDLHRAAYARMKTCFNADLLAEKRALGHPSDRPIFIVGMPRSGTTLTEQILASHGQITGAGELPDMRKIAASLGRGDLDKDLFARNVAKLTKGQINKLASQYLAVLKQHSSSSARVVDKLPHNYELIGLISILFPNAQIIHCQRSPMDTCVSCFTHNFSSAHGYNGDLETLGHYYHAYVDLMDHWERVLPGRILHSRYEDLIDDQTAASRRLIAWTGLAWDDACLSFQNTERMVKTPSRWQVRQPIYKTSMASWKKYAAHLQPLQKVLGPLAED